MDIQSMVVLVNNLAVRKVQSKPLTKYESLFYNEALQSLEKQCKLIRLNIERQIKNGRDSENPGSDPSQDITT